MAVLEEYYDVIDVAKAIGSFSKSGILLWNIDITSNCGNMWRILWW